LISSSPPPYDSLFVIIHSHYIRCCINCSRWNQLRYIKKSIIPCSCKVHI
jgi:hypothetical protein